MLSTFVNPSLQLVHHHSDGNHVTRLALQNRRDESVLWLAIVSALPLSVQEVRSAINAQLGDHWQWRQLFCMAEILN